MQGSTHRFGDLEVSCNQRSLGRGESTENVKQSYLSIKRNMTRWIAASLLILFVLRWPSLAEASHFRHGSIAWEPANNYSNKVELIN